MITLYGIPNCDQVARARRWLQENKVDYDFFDFKKQTLKLEVLRNWLEQLGADKLINKRSATWRQLSKQQQTDLIQLDSKLGTEQAQTTLQIVVSKPTLIKRPVLCYKDQVHLGFDQSNYQTIFK